MGLVTDEQREVIQARVHAGALRFDQEAPPNWAGMISGRDAELDVGNPSACPLAIVYGSYHIGLTTLGIGSGSRFFAVSRSKASAELGFTLVAGDPLLSSVDAGDGTDWVREAFAVMTDAWRSETAARLVTA